MTSYYGRGTLWSSIPEKSCFVGTCYPEAVAESSGPRFVVRTMVYRNLPCMYDQSTIYSVHRPRGLLPRV